MREPASVAGVCTLLEQGRLDAAEQMCVKLTRAGVSAALAPALLSLAKACRDASRVPAAVAWLKRLSIAAPNVHNLEAAQLALHLDRPQLASLLFEKADKCRSLSIEDSLCMAQAILRASELLRQPHGRQGAWAQHEDYLRKATALFRSLSGNEALPPQSQAQAWTGLARALRLQRADPRQIEAALARAAALLSGLNAASVVSIDDVPHADLA